MRSFDCVITYSVRLNKIIKQMGLCNHKQSKLVCLLSMKASQG